VTRHPENQDKAEQKVSRDELSEQELEKASGGLQITKKVDKASPGLLLDTGRGKQIP
jgi:type VI protein secretion system component Hcp